MSTSPYPGPNPARTGSDQPLSMALGSAIESLERCEGVARQIAGGLYGYQPEAVPSERKEDIPPPYTRANQLSERLAALGDKLQDIASRI